MSVSNHKCEICDDLASVHIVDIVTGRRRSFCDQHSKSQDVIPKFNENVLVNYTLKIARLLLQFANDHGHFPSLKEAQTLGVVGFGSGFSHIDPNSPQFYSCIEYLQELISYIEVHHKLPAEGEISSDPF